MLSNRVDFGTIYLAENRDMRRLKLRYTTIGLRSLTDMAPQLRNSTRWSCGNFVGRVYGHATAAQQRCQNSEAGAT